MPRTIKFLLQDATAPVDGDELIEDLIATSFQATIRGTGALTGNVIIEASNDSKAVPADVLWSELGTIALSGTGEDNGIFGDIVPYLLYRARLTAITGTDASVDVIMCV